MASVFFEDRSVVPSKLAEWLAASRSHHFNDLLFCLQYPSPGFGCNRPARVQDRAIALGWNADCSGAPSAQCGRGDLLFGRALSSRLEATSEAPLQRPLLLGRLMVSPADSTTGALGLLPIGPAELAGAASCRQGDKWNASACTNPRIRALVNQAFGQGDARATALGVATMLSRIAASALGQESVRRPFLVAQVSDAAGRPVPIAALRTQQGQAMAAPLPVQVAPAVARQVLDAMARGSQRHGTAWPICQHVFGAACAVAGPRFAGKTGTPSFGFDKRSLTEARAACVGARPESDCGERPVKWYVAAYARDGTGQRDKVVAVMSERNWYLPQAAVPPHYRDRVQDSGYPGVREPDSANISAELAMRLMAAEWAAAGAPVRPAPGAARR